MPKVASSTKDKLRKFVREFGSDVLSTDNEIIFCKICEKPINSDKKFHIAQHLNGKGHKAASTKNTTHKQSLLAQLNENTSRLSTFSMDLCNMLIETGIPFWKVEHPSFRKFVENYTKQKVPSESSLRKTYLDKAYQEKITQIRRGIGNSNIWVSIDETTDAVGR